MKPVFTPVSFTKPEPIAALIDLELVLMMAALFRASTHSHPSEATPHSRVQVLLSNATDSGVGVLIGIFVRQVLVLIASALVIAAIIG